MLPVNYLAILACGILSMVLGFLWYGPLFGKLWMTLEGMPHDAMERAKSDPAAKNKMMQGYAIQFVMSLIMVYVLALAVRFGSINLAETGLPIGLQTAFFCWLGFVAPPTMGMVLWEGKPWKLWALINAYWLVFLLIAGAVVALWP